MAPVGRKRKNEIKNYPLIASHDLYAKYRCWYLRFLLDFFTATGLTPYTFGRLTDNPPSTSQALRKQLKNDDMKVSRAKQIVSNVGYKLDIEFNDKKNAVKEVLGYTLILPKKLQDNLEKGILKKEEQNKNLRFLKNSSPGIASPKGNWPRPLG